MSFQPISNKIFSKSWFIGTPPPPYSHLFSALFIFSRKKNIIYLSEPLVNANIYLMSVAQYINITKSNDVLANFNTFVGFDQTLKKSDILSLFSYFFEYLASDAFMSSSLLLRGSLSLLIRWIFSVDFVFQMTIM